MFVAKDQEYTDIHTGITIAFGEHYQNVDVPAGSPGSPAGRLSWLRISVPADGDKPAKIATLQLSNGQIVRSDKHEATPAGETSDADAARIAGTIEVLPEDLPRYDVRGAVKDDSPTEEVAPTKKKKHY
jgi:hypothetical protein